VSRKQLLSVTTLLLVLVAQLSQPGPTYACSAGLDFNPVAEADLVVGGRITSWERLSSTSNAPFTPIRLTMAVDQRFKGEAGATLQFADATSLAWCARAMVGVPSSM
jgi:hypothetical protein